MHIFDYLKERGIKKKISISTPYKMYNYPQLSFVFCERTFNNLNFEGLSPSISVLRNIHIGIDKGSKDKKYLEKIQKEFLKKGLKTIIRPNNQKYKNRIYINWRLRVETSKNHEWKSKLLVEQFRTIFKDIIKKHNISVYNRFHEEVQVKFNRWEDIQQFFPYCTESSKEFWINQKNNRIDNVINDMKMKEVM